MDEVTSRHQVVIVGGGFAGLYAARTLRGAPVDVTVVDSSNHHLFQPLLYQVATGALSPGDIASPIRGILRRHRNVRVVRDTAVGLDPEERKLILERGTLHYDTLIVTAGLQNHYFGHDEWEQNAPGLKSLSDAVLIRTRVLAAFERAEMEPDDHRRAANLTIAVVGGGPTGVETAGALAELTRDTLRNDFRSVDPRNARIMLLEGGSRILPTFHPSLSARAAKDLGKMGVEVVTDAWVTAVEPGRILLKHGETETKVETETVIWSAGIRGAPFGTVLADTFGAKTDSWGRIIVGDDLRLPGHPEVFVAGDLAAVPHRDATVPMVAPAAIQEGKHVAKSLLRSLKGKKPRRFAYFDKGSLAVIGRNRAVVQVAGMRIGGFFAWMIWILIHILFLIEFDNKILVMFQWGWTYFTRKRGARLILD